MGLPEGCAQTRNRTGLLALCLHPSHRRAAGAPAVCAARPHASRDSAMAETPNLAALIHQGLLVPPSRFPRLCREAIRPAALPFAWGTAASGCGRSFPTGGAEGGCGQQTSPSPSCAASPRAVPPPTCPFSLGTAYLHTGRDCRWLAQPVRGRPGTPRTWAVSLGGWHPASRPRSCRGRGHASEAVLAAARLPLPGGSFGG